MRMFFRSVFNFFKPNKVWLSLYFIMLTLSIACQVLSIFVDSFKDYLIFGFLGTAWSTAGYLLCECKIDKKGGDI